MHHDDEKNPYNINNVHIITNDIKHANLFLTAIIFSGLSLRAPNSFGFHENCPCMQKLIARCFTVYQHKSLRPQWVTATTLLISILARQWSFDRTHSSTSIDTFALSSDDDQGVFDYMSVALQQSIVLLLVDNVSS